MYLEKFVCHVQAQYPEGIIFSQLDHLELCTCDDSKWLNILAMLLPDSPKLRVLKLNDKVISFPVHGSSLDL